MSKLILVTIFICNHFAGIILASPSIMFGQDHNQTREVGGGNAQE
jgi:hypothetical protein